MLLNEREKVEINKFKNLKTFTDYSQTIHVYGNLEDYNSTNKNRVFILFNDIGI